MTDTPSPTPETDAQFSSNRTFPAGLQELREFAARMEKERDEARSEVARLKAGGCAMDQRTTQFCAEAVKAIAERDEARAAFLCAMRLWRNRYLPWSDAGGESNCSHGYGGGIPCPKCDSETAHTYERKAAGLEAS